jgi:hypothetical protein
MPPTELRGHRLACPILGFKSFWSAAITLSEPQSNLIRYAGPVAKYLQRPCVFRMQATHDEIFSTDSFTNDNS